MKFFQIKTSHYRRRHKVINTRVRSYKLTAALLSLLFAVISIPDSYGAAPAVPVISSVTESTNTAFGAGTVTVTWNASTGATSYSAMLTKQGSSDTPTVITNEDASQLQATFRGLSGGTTYVVQVKAFTGVEASAWSANTRTVVPKTFPKAPGKPSVVKGIRRATVSWTALTAAETGGYEVSSYLVTEINSSKTVSVTGTSTEALVTGLSNGADVEFTVAAITAAGASGSTSDKSEKYVLDDVPSTPDAPVLATTDTAGELRSTWNAPSKTNGSNLVSYVVKLIKDGVDFLSQPIEKIVDTFHTFTGLLAGKYTSKVVATNGVGDSAWSAASNEITIASTASAAPSASASASSSSSPSATPSATPSASPSPSTSPSPSATPTESSAPSAPPISGGGGGGFVGGGALPAAVVPLVSPSPTPSPKVSLTASPVPTASASASVQSSAKPTPTTTPTKSSTPSPSTTASPITTAKVVSPTAAPTKLPVIAKNSYVAPTQITRATKILTVKTANSTQTLKTNASLSVAIPAVKKGTSVTINMKTPDGKVIKIQSIKTTRTGTFTVPTLKFTKPGTYKVVAKIGSSFKLITVKVAR